MRISFGRAAAALILSASILTVGLNAQIALDPSAQKAKTKIEKIGQNRDVTIKTTAGREVYGSVKDIGAEFVTIRDASLNQEIDIRYAEIKSVEKGDHTRAANAKRASDSKKATLAVAFAFGLLAGVIVLLANIKD
ncbi:MAG TPA: hypothetical protein VGO43_00690 [Pyrinomonadaceae bacterium]|jgi:hypothetical protein|nr:hypothetical protein [Pyrinomonadaceae bacterium]